MCLKIRCDGESWKVFEFWVEVNKAIVCDWEKGMVFRFVSELI